MRPIENLYKNTNPKSEDKHGLPFRVSVLPKVDGDEKVKRSHMQTPCRHMKAQGTMIEIFQNQRILTFSSLADLFRFKPAGGRDAPQTS